MNELLNLDADLEFAASSVNPDAKSLDFDSQEFRDNVGTGFNDFGVRQNKDDDGNIRSVDVVFEAMEPGPPKRRNGVRITESFLREIADKDYSQEPLHLKDHRSKDTFADIGSVRQIWFSEQAQKLALMVNVPNTGGPTHDEAISRYTWEPPQIKNGSVGLGTQYKAVRNENGEPELVDGKVREFSTVNFPGGYDSGGVASAFAEAAKEALIEFDGHGDGDMNPDPEELEQVYEQWNSLVNMSDEQMEWWDDHPCADAAVDHGEDARDETLMLIGQPMESWSQKNLDIANRAIDFMVSETEGEMPEDAADGGPGTCPTRWAVNLLNRGHNPFDEMPSGNPQFGRIETRKLGFDDEAHADNASENSVTDSDKAFSGEVETLTF